MQVLVIDTSSAAVLAAIVRIELGSADEERSQMHFGGRTHSEELPGLIQQVLDSEDNEGIRAVVVGRGPGPFTGLRVGLTTAAAFAEARGIPAYGVCSLDGYVLPAGRILLATEARRQEVYWAVYEDRVRVAGPGVARPAALDTTGCDAMYGEGARRYADVIGLPLVPSHAPFLNKPWPDIPNFEQLTRLAQDRIESGAPGEVLTPLYLREPDAVPPPGLR